MTKHDGLTYEERRSAKIVADPEYAAKRKRQRQKASRLDKLRGNEAARDDARKALGQTYFTGKPCKRGHVAERYSVNQTCVECTKLQQIEAEEKRRQRRDSDPEFGAHRRAQRALSNRGYVKRNRSKKNADWAEWFADRLRRTPPWADLQMIKKFYEEAAKLTKETGEPWHVDHIIPLRGEIVSGLHLAENLRVIKGIENLKKGAKFMAS
jgi:hypothetical protein